MYCKHCGKEIAEDSAFCQYCGGQIQEQEQKKPNGSLLNGFKSLSKGWQICIMVYIIWFLSGMCILVGNSGYGRRFGEDVLLPVLIVVVAVPLLVLFLWYYFARLRKTEKNNTIEDPTMTSVVLMDFAKQYGKMQVKTVANPTTNEVRSYCVFTNENGKETKVEFSESLGALRPQEIAGRKEQLVVVRRLDGSFELCAK